MKKNVIKSFGVVVLQLVAVCLLWPIVLAERALTWCLWRLGTLGLCGSACSVLGDIVKRREAHKDTGEALTPTPLSSKPVQNLISSPKIIPFELEAPPRLDYPAVWAYIERCGDNFIAAFREHVEREWGVPEWARKDNPRLYAVLLPNREENLERLSYAMCNVPRDHLHKWFGEVASCLKRKH